MKRFYNLLSFFLLSLVGITNAVAQDYGQGALLETPDQVVNKDVLLYEPGTSDDHPAGYLCSGSKFTNVLSDDCIYNIIPLEKQSADGHPLYVIKHKASGKYVMDPDKILNAEGEDAIAYTDKLADAFETTVLNFVEVQDGQQADPRTAANSKKQDLSLAGFVFCRDQFDKDKETGADVPVYIAGQWGPCYFPYTDTNVFRIHEFKVLKGTEKLTAYAEAFVVDVTQYNVGTTPGTYKADIVKAAEDAYNAVNNALNAGTVTDEQADKLCADLKAAYENLQKNGFNGLVDGGYYFIHTVTNHWATTKEFSGVEFIYTTGSGTYPDDKAPAAGEVQVKDAKYIWQMTSAGKKDLYYVQNLFTGKYMSAITNPALKGDKDCFKMVDEKTPLFVAFDGNDGANKGFVFYFMKADSTKGRQFHSKHANAGVFEWNDVKNPNNIFKFDEVSKADVDKIAGQVEQEALNEKMNKLYGEAFVDYAGSLAFTGGTKDADFKNGIALDSTNFFSTVAHNGEGTTKCLADGSFGYHNVSDSYFHTSWAQQFTPSLSRYHYIGVDLGKEIKGGVTVKLAKRRTYNDYPTAMAFFGTNDPKAVVDSADWTLLGVSKVDWSIGMPLTAADYTDVEADTTIANAIGLAGTTFDGSYRYIKCAAIATIFNEKNALTNRGFFCLSEMAVYDNAQVDPNGGLIQQVSEPVRKEMADALAAAKAEVAAGKATQATLDRLQKAYDAFMKELPDPSKILDAAAKAKRFADNLENGGFVGDKLGQYNPAGLEALRAAVDAANAFDPTGKLAAEINAEVEKLDAAMAAFKAGINLPAAGKFYMIRGASKKAWNKQLTSFRAPLYARNNAVKDAIRFTRPNGAKNEAIETGEGGVVTDATWDAVVAALSDTIDASLTPYYWYVESAKDAKIVLRNVATGMYLAPQEGEVRQSVTPFEIPVQLTKPECFVFDAGKEKQLNTASNGVIVTWADANDWNAQFTFEEVAQLDMPTYGIEVANQPFQILTLPVEVDAYFIAGGAPYSLVGETDTKKLALAEIADVIPAGTPFILVRDMADAQQNLAKGFAQMTYSNGLSDGTVTTMDAFAFNFNALEANGIQGTLCENDTVGAGYAFLRDGVVKPTHEDGTVIGANCGWFNAKHATGVAEGTVNLDLGKIVINEITEADVVVLPSVVDVYSVDGVLVRKNVKAANAVKGLPAGVYVVGNVKVLVK